MTNDWSWPGARWWKFDFHTHTPQSYDYGKGLNQADLKKYTPQQWLQDFVNAGIHCVAITDHNSGAWIDELKKAHIEMNLQEKLYLFPGVEISVQGGIHILAIFGQDKTTADIDSLLGAVGFNGTKGGSDDVTHNAATQVIDEIVRAGGLAIPAHVDKASGLFKVFSGQTLRQILDKENIIAMELCDKDYSKPALYNDKKLAWAEILGSDAHHPTGPKSPGSHYTWIKMGKPNLEGLRLALLDGALSIKRSDKTQNNPNSHADLIIESLTISNARYFGRKQEFKCSFNPWLNTIIGSRGTGKSTLLEFMRLVLRREKELPDSLSADFEKYQIPYSNKKPGLLTNETKISLIYRKNASRYRLYWHQSGGAESPIEMQTESGDWLATQGEIAQRFPARIFSQKQIFELAENPLALLKIIDDLIDFTQWKQEWRELENSFLRSHAQIRETQTKLSEESRLQGALDDVTSKLRVFEKGDHAHVLQTYQKAQRQLRQLENWENSWHDIGQRIRAIAADLAPEELETQEIEAEFLQDAQKLTAALHAFLAKFEPLAEQADKLTQEWQEIKQHSDWFLAWDTASKNYQALQAALHSTGVNITDYGALMQERQRLETELHTLKSLRETLDNFNFQADDYGKKLQAHRLDLTQRRKTFLEQTLEHNLHVEIKVIPYGECAMAIDSFREIIQRATGLDRDIGDCDENPGIIHQLYFSNATLPFTERLDKFKKDLKNKNNGYTKHFANHLQKIRPEEFDRINIWFPEDSLAVSYSRDGKNFTPITQGSPGQKTAALLAFFLSCDNEPLILDQPEDDLDNHLIYSLIVKQLREIKPRRQVIIVTHNANIVVNGDAELIISLDAKGGQTIKQAEGCLQEKQVRTEICNIMEGGEHAFTRRYQRITAKD